MPNLRFAACLFLLTACAPNVVDGRASGEIDVPPAARRLEVVLEKGSISVHAAEDANRISWEAATRKGATDPQDLELLEGIEVKFETSFVGETLRIVGPRVPAELAQRDLGAAVVLKLSLFVPARLDLALRTERGPIGIDAWGQSVDLHTGAGDIRLENVTGPCKTFTGAGHHMVTGQRGAADFATDHGDFLVYFDEVPDDGIKLHTDAGSIQCNLPPGASFDLEAKAQLGEIETLFDVSKSALGARGQQASGVVGDGGSKVVLSSRIGSVTVREYTR